MPVWVGFGGLLVAQGGDGVNFGGPASGQISGQQGHRDECGGDGSVRERVAGLDVVKKAGDKPRSAQREKHAGSNAEQRELKSEPNNKAQHVGGAGAESDANANFAGALIHIIGHDAVDAHHRQQNR